MLNECVNNINFFQIYVTLYIWEILTFVSPYTMALTTIKKFNNEQRRTSGDTKYSHRNQQ